LEESTGSPGESAAVGATSTRTPAAAAAPDEAGNGSPAPGGGPERRRYAWADLLRRVFAIEVLECPECRGPLRILAAIHPPVATRAILECLGLPARAPPAAPARPQPQSPQLAAAD